MTEQTDTGAEAGAEAANTITETNKSPGIVNDETVTNKATPDKPEETPDKPEETPDKPEETPDKPETKLDEALAEDITDTDIAKQRERFTKDGKLDENALLKSVIEMRRSRDKANTPVTDEAQTEQIEESFKEHNLAWHDDEQRDHYLGAFKTQNFNKEQISWILEQHAAQQATVFETYGAPPDAAAEQKEWAEHSHREVQVLKTQHGWDNDKLNQVNDFIKKLDPELQSLKDTAVGFIAADKLLNSARGSESIKDLSSGTTEDVASYQKQINDLVNDPEWRHNPKLQEQAEIIAGKMAKANAQS